MQILQKNIDVDNYREQVKKVLESNTKSLVFLDTNFLTWIYRINTSSFKELSDFLYKLVQDQKLIIPNWVVHEYNNLLGKNSEEVFSPFKKRLRIAEKEIDYLLQTSRMVVDDVFAKKKGFKSKREFITSMEADLKAVHQKIGHLKEYNEFKDEGRSKFIEEIVGEANMTFILNNLDQMPVHFNLRIPPGHEDQGNLENKYGDMIIWQEILQNTKAYGVDYILFLSYSLTLLF